ncbi:MAG: hypothetical protein IKO19_03635, partial [Candidatus Riflebacteria bacterium]|nr:hypothetical protein [Candidatus Riflebacteria bacterium]
MRKITVVMLAAVLSLMTFVSPVQAADDQGLSAAISMQKAFVNVAKQLKQSVVNIKCEKTTQVSSAFGLDSDEDSDEAEEFLRKFFRMPRGNKKEEKILG